MSNREKKNTIWSHLHVESEGKKKKKQVTDSDNRLVLPGVWGEGWAKRVKEVKRYRFTVIE